MTPPPTTLPDAFLGAPLAHRAYHDRAAGRPENSRAAFRAAIEAGYGLDPSNIRWMERDADLSAVRKLPEYQALLTKLRASFR